MGRLPDRVAAESRLRYSIAIRKEPDSNRLAVKGWSDDGNSLGSCVDRLRVSPSAETIKAESRRRLKPKRQCG